MAAGASSWSFEERDFQRIDRLLQGFLYDSNARCALLVDRTLARLFRTGKINDILAKTFGKPPADDLLQALTVINSISDK